MLPFHLGRLVLNKDTYPAGVRRDHDHVLGWVIVGDVAGQQILRPHVVDRAVEESLDLIGVQIHGDDAVGAGGFEEVGDEACGDRLAAAMFLILSGIGVERHDRGDPFGAAPLEGVDHDQLFHEPGVQWRGMGLQHEGVAAPHRLVEPYEDLPVGEIARGLGGHMDIKFLGDLLGQLGMRPAGEEHQILAVVGPVRAHVALPSPVGIEYGSNRT